MNKRTILIYVAGTLIFFGSAIKWFAMTPDPSQLVMGCSIGLFTMAFAYIYDWMILYTKKFHDLQRRVDENWFKLHKTKENLE